MPLFGRDLVVLGVNHISGFPTIQGSAVGPVLVRVTTEQVVGDEKDHYNPGDCRPD